MSTTTLESDSKQCKVSQENDSKDKEPEELSITEDELNAIKNNWLKKTQLTSDKLEYPVLPKKGARNILITSALPYVNNIPHLGNIIGCVLSADIFARYCRQKNFNTLFIGGTDEYGTATEAKVLEEKMSCKEICDKYYNIHNEVYSWFNIAFDRFGRTTTKEQTEVVQDFFMRVRDEGFIFTDTVDQLRCEGCEKFLADRFVEGTCPDCKYEDARGDQCDGCGHLINAPELINPRCKLCNQTPVIKSSEHFFLDLPKIEPKVKEWVTKAESKWSSVARAIAKPWLRDGLKSRCITRDIKWGIPVPLDGYQDKVFYVWFDAPLGYLSISKNYHKDYEQWWKPEKEMDVSLYQFMAKDNVPFHAIMFPASLLAANQGYILVKHIMAVEYLNYEDTKFSKSRGVGVFGSDARDTGIPADVWRFYLAYVRPEGQDTNFNWTDLATKTNSELLNNFGNFVNRSLAFAEKNYDGVIQEIELRDEEYNLLAHVQRELTQYNLLMEQAKLRDSLKIILSISKLGNQYLQAQQPWAKIKGNDDDKKIAGTVSGICCNLSCLLSSLIGPFMPMISLALRSQLGLESHYGLIPDTVTILLYPGHKIGKSFPLFTRITDKEIQAFREKFGGVKEEKVKKNKKTQKQSKQNKNPVADLEKSMADLKN
ncbi:methionine--tRNA ligase, cytoplasmic [Microplitis mediator]|uniref:methionine--tRNA ligase, cytoplasmic n=1 Tax=Microplitis mediator TaxID=375433 RepID=UPI002554FE12|nr:methionine--tRNA ligase, cytoplasmic [Microplitis mediator]